MKEFIKTLNNFRLSSLLMAIGSAVGIIAAVLFIIFYQISGITINSDGVEVVVTAFHTNQVAQMFFFIADIIAIILGIVVIYQAFPYIFPKAKGIPNKVLGWVLLAENVFLVILIVMAFVLLATEETRVAGGWVVSIMLATFSAAFSGLWIYPNLKCNFYCPELSAKELAKK